MDTQDSPWPGLGGSHHLPLIVYSAPLHGAHIQMVFCLGTPEWESRNCPSWDSRDFGALITLRADLGLKCGPKQDCIPRRELFNGMSHAISRQINWFDSRLFSVKNQIASLTPSFSSGHNLYFKCPNEQCEPILDIYVSRAFQWYKKHHKPLSFDPSNRSLKFRQSIGTPSPKVGVLLGVWGFPPSHFPTLSGGCDVTFGLSLGPHPCNPLALVASPKLGLQQMRYDGVYHTHIHHKKSSHDFHWNPCFQQGYLSMVVKSLHRNMLEYLMPQVIPFNLDATFCNQGWNNSNQFI
jgi:hypothetical protein